MHIPASMLQGRICPVTLTLATAAVGIAAYQAYKMKDKPTAAKFSAVTALVFAMQMLNFPVQNGTSGHLVGAVLAVSFLGIPWAVLAMTLVLAVQAVFFGDGGLNALGANIINMGVIGAVVGGMLLERMKKIKLSQTISLAIASWVAVVAAAFACSVEVALAGTVAFTKVIPAMLGVHFLIGIGEAVITVSLVAILNQYSRVWKLNENAFALSSFSLAILAALCSPFASSFPDGLEWAADKLAFSQFAGVNFTALFPDYQFLAISHAAWSTIAAGLAGVGIIAVTAALVGSALTGSKSKQLA